MNNIWFTADTHFGHAKVVEYSNRPFADLEEMTQQLITRWNAVVAKGDIVYHLGDFALSYGAKSRSLINDILDQLNGSKWLITGNHDRPEVTTNPRWTAVKNMHEIKVDCGSLHKQRIVLCHYALRTWNQMHRGAWMLHGHSHGNLPDVGGKILDVGVDVWDYTPVSFSELARHMAARPIRTEDHHRVDEAEDPEAHVYRQALLGDEDPAGEQAMRTHTFFRP